MHGIKIFQAHGADSVRNVFETMGQISGDPIPSSRFIIAAGPAAIGTHAQQPIRLQIGMVERQHCLARVDSLRAQRVDNRKPILERVDLHLERPERFSTRTLIFLAEHLALVSGPGEKIRIVIAHHWREILEHGPVQNTFS